MHVSVCHIQEFLTPNTTSLLVEKGFFSALNPKYIENDYEGPNISTLADKIYHFIPDLTQLQVVKIKSIVSNFYIHIKIVREERLNLNEELQNYFNQKYEVALTGEEPQRPNIQQYFTMAVVIDMLRKNLEEESELYMDHMDQMVAQTLSVRQMATFILYIEHTVLSVQQLKAIWQTFNQQL